MSRKPRLDASDTWHHVMNRGIARRTLFESRTDVRKFLSLIAREVRRGTIEVHAYCVMTTHFHLLVRSPEGSLSTALQWIEGSYARWFNRGRRRDGALLRARFTSVPVTSSEHWGATVAYIDRNPVDAHLVTKPSAYPWCSAAHYAREKGPRWLTRGRVEALIADRAGRAAFDPASYDAIVASSWPEDLAAWVDRALLRRVPVDPSFDDLVAAAPGQVRDWMARKARLADGTADRTLVVSAGALERSFRQAISRRADWTIVVRNRRRSAWDAMRVGLLRSAAAATRAEIAAKEGISDASVRRRESWHSVAVETCPGYADAAAEVMRDALRGGESDENGSGTVPTLSTSRGT